MTLQRPNKVNSLLSALLEMRDVAHLHHLKSTSYAEHMALGDFYDSLLDLSDNLIESYQGVYGLQQISITNVKPTSPISDLESFYSLLEASKEGIKESWVVNEIDNICTLTAKTLYKLKFLK
jgi:hypothetical protein